MLKLPEWLNGRKFFKRAFLNDANKKPAGIQESIRRYGRQMLIGWILLLLAGLCGALEELWVALEVDGIARFLLWILLLSNFVIWNRLFFYMNSDNLKIHVYVFMVVVPMTSAITLILIARALLI